MSIIKPLTKLPVGSNIEQIKEHLSASGALNGSFIAIRATEYILTGDKDKLLRKGKNILSIAEYPTEQIVSVYNVVVDNINDNKVTGKKVVEFLFSFITKALNAKGIKLPDLIK